MVQENCGIEMTPSRQELDLRISAVDQLLIRRNGMLIDQQCYMVCNGFTAGYVEEHEEPEDGGEGLQRAAVEEQLFAHRGGFTVRSCGGDIPEGEGAEARDIAEEEDLIEELPADDERLLVCGEDAKEGGEGVR